MNAKKPLHNLPARIKRSRIRANLTPLALSRILGISDSVVRRWETGRATPSLSAALAFAEATGVDLHWLLTGKESIR